MDVNGDLILCYPVRPSVISWALESKKERSGGSKSRGGMCRKRTLRRIQPVILALVLRMKNADSLWKLRSSSSYQAARPWGPQGHGDHRPITAENRFLPTAPMRLEANSSQGLQQDHRFASTSRLACEIISENSWVTWPRSLTCRLVRYNCYFKELTVSSLLWQQQRANTAAPARTRALQRIPAFRSCRDQFHGNHRIPILRPQWLVAEPRLSPPPPGLPLTTGMGSGRSMLPNIGKWHEKRDLLNGF